MSMDVEEQLMRDRKRRQFENGGSSSPSRVGRWATAAVAIALLFGIGAWFWGGGSSDEPRVATPAPALPVAVAIRSKAVCSESVSASVICLPFTVNVPAVMALPIGRLASVVPETSLVALSPRPISDAPSRRAAVASCDTAIL